MRILGRVFFSARRRALLTTTQQIFRKNSFCIANSRPNSTKSNRREVVETSAHQEETAVQTTVVRKVVEGTKTVTYLGVIIVGLGFGAALIYVVCSELFSSNSPNRVYSRALDYVSKDTRIQNAIGDQIKGFGEESRRGRRQHVSHAKYQKDGLDLLRMKFYIKGNRGSGTVNLEMYKNEKGKYDYRYLFVVLDDMLQRTIILEDNRSKASSSVQGGSFPELQDSNLPEIDLSLK